MPIASIVLSFPQIGIFDKVSITLDGLPGVGIASGMDLLDAALLGMASGAICVSRDGAQEAMGSKTEVLALMDSKTK